MASRLRPYYDYNSIQKENKKALYMEVTSCTDARQVIIVGRSDTLEPN